MSFRLFDRSRLKERVAALERLLQEMTVAQGAETAALRANIETLHARIEALQAGNEALEAGNRSLQASRDDLRVRNEALQASHEALQNHVTAVQKHLDAVHGHVLSTDRALKRLEGRFATTREEWIERGLALERLLTASAAARPPGALEAVSRLPKPHVSVIVPTYNRARFIGEAIASVQGQSLQSWELIIVDDGSTDGTEAAVAPFLEDRRITYIRQERAGSAAARNRGIRESSAPFIAYLDSDNVWYPDFLACAVDCMATEPDVDLVYGALVTDHHKIDGSRILWEPFSRDRLLLHNFIDTNVIVHRRTLVSCFEGWDESLGRLLDWDLALRYTGEKPARRLDVLAAYCRVCDDQRISTNTPVAPSLLAITHKWFPPANIPRRPRVLYAVWHYPQLSESYVETEIACLRRWGVHIEVWRSEAGVSPYPTDVPIHDGTLAEAIEAVRPDIIHSHWLSFAHGQLPTLATAGIPVTLRLHGFDVTRESLTSWLAHSWAAVVYAFPNQIARCGIAESRLKSTPVAFDSTLFAPRRDKDRRLIVRAAAALASKDLELFLQAARTLPEYRFVLAAVTCRHREEFVGELKAMREKIGSPAEILFDVPRKAVAELIGKAGIYLHTVLPAGVEDATPLGQPSSIAEAMATGCYCFVRDLPDLKTLVGEAGDTYRDLDELVEKIRATGNWTHAEWSQAQQRAADRASFFHADVVVFREMFNDWMKLSEKSAVP